MTAKNSQGQIEYLLVEQLSGLKIFARQDIQSQEEIPRMEDYPTLFFALQIVGVVAVFASFTFWIFCFRGRRYMGTYLREKDRANSCSRLK